MSLLFHTRYLKCFFNSAGLNPTGSPSYLKLDFQDSNPESAWVQSNPDSLNLFLFDTRSPRLILIFNHKSIFE